MILLSRGIYVEPISMNNAYPTNPWTKRRFLSHDGEFYKEAIAQLVPAGFVTPQIDKNRGLELEISYFIPPKKFFNQNGTWKKFDVSNYLKLTEDAILEKIGIDDSYVASISGRKIPLDLGNDRFAVHVLLAFNQHVSERKQAGEMFADFIEARGKCMVCAGKLGFKLPDGYFREEPQFGDDDPAWLPCPECHAKGSYVSDHLIWDPQKNQKWPDGGKKCCAKDGYYVRRYGPVFKVETQTVVVLYQCRKCHQTREEAA